MLSQQVRGSATLIDSIDAIRNWRAAALLLGTFVAFFAVIAVGVSLSAVTGMLTAAFALLAYAVVFYGINAVGMMMMDEAQGRPARAPGVAMRDSLAVSHRLLGVFLLVGLAYLAGVVVFAVILWICRLPLVGPVLYVAVFPLGVLVSGLALFALPTVIFPLSAPAVWRGDGVLDCLRELVAIARERLVMVLMLMIAVTLIISVVAFVVGGIFFSGAAFTTLLSGAVLSGDGGLTGAISSALGGLVGGDPDVGETVGAHATAGALGGSLLFAGALTLPGLVYLRGASMVYLRAVAGLARDDTPG